MTPAQDFVAFREHYATEYHVETAFALAAAVEAYLEGRESWQAVAELFAWRSARQLKWDQKLWEAIEMEQQSRR